MGLFGTIRDNDNGAPLALVYLLWTHQENGPEDLVATTDKSKVADLASKMNTNNWFKAVGKPHLIADLNRLLETDGNKVGIYPLMDGWGGLHLQIVELV